MGLVASMAAVETYLGGRLADGKVRSRRRWGASDAGAGGGDGGLRDLDISTRVVSPALYQPGPIIFCENSWDEE